MIEFDIDNKIYPAKDLTELSIKQYEQLLNILNDDLPELKKIYDILEILTDIPIDLIKKINVNSLIQIDWGLLLSVDTTLIPIKPIYKIKDKEYNLPKFNNIPFGKFIDIDYYLQIPSEDKMVSVLALILCQDTNYTIEDIEALKFNISRHLNIMDGLTIMDSYINWRNDLYKKYEGLFQSNEEPEEDENDDEIFDEPEDDEEPIIPEYNPIWVNIMYRLADNVLNVDKVSKQPILSIMNWLTYEKEEADKEEERYEQMKNKNKY